MARKTPDVDFEKANLANAGMEELEAYEKWLFSQADEAEQEKRLQAVFKTVDTFAALMDRKMWVKNSSTAYTDGHEIGIPFSSKYAYEYAEHEIAHNLFLSNFKAKELFCNEYVKQIAVALMQNNSALTNEGREQLSDMVGMLLNVLEDHRVNSLWAMLYPGSYKRLVESAAETMDRHRNRAHDDLVAFFLMIAYDLKVPSGRYDRFAPAMIAALKKVERKGPSAAFVVGKWLMTQLVSEIIRQLQGLPPPPQAGKARVQTDLDNMGASTQTSGGKDGGDNAGTPAGGATGSDSNNGNGNGGDADWTPPEVQSSKEDRVDALKKLVEFAGQQAKSMNASKERLKDVQDDRFEKRGQSRVAEEMVKSAMDTNVQDASSLGLHLARSEAAMNKTIEAIKEALEEAAPVSEDEWITRDAHAKVVFADVSSNSAYKPPAMSPEDTTAMRRLRETFQRVKSRRSKALSDVGHEVDIEAFIANKTSRTLGPVFKQEVSGRGFKTLILVDRSSSMGEDRTNSVERATRILRRSLKQPSVEFNVWGFKSDSRTVQLCRLDSTVDLQNRGEMAVGGATPLHIAVKTAINWLGSGHEKKQLIILTDGVPCFTSSSGRNYSEEQLMGIVQKEITRARKQGINVTSFIVGHDVSDKSAKMMFGDKKNWTRAESDTIGKDLVRVVSSSFTQYLSNC